MGCRVQRVDWDEVVDKVPSRSERAIATVCAETLSSEMDPKVYPPSTAAAFAVLHNVCLEIHQLKLAGWSSMSTSSQRNLCCRPAVPDVAGGRVGPQTARTT